MPTRSGRLIAPASSASAPAAVPAPAPEPSPAPTPAPASGDLSAYELQRLANIRANEAVLASLNLTSMRAELGMPPASSASRPSQRGVGSARKRSATPMLPTRTSSRTQGLTPVYTGIQVEHADGRVETEAGVTVMPGSNKAAKLEEKLHPATPIPFHRVNDDDVEQDDKPDDPAAPTKEEDDDDEDQPLINRLPSKRAAAALPPPDARDLALLRLVAHDAATTTRRGTSSASSSSTSTTKKAAAAPSPSAAACLTQATLDESMVVKATKSAVVHMRFQPRHDTLLLAAADKDGHVSFWHASRDEDDPSDGVHLHKPHSQYVSGLVWCPHNPQAVFSSSYDGTVKCLHAERRQFVTLHHAPEHEFSAFTIDPTKPDALWLGTNDGEIGTFDARSGSVVNAFASRHKKKVNTLSLDAHGSDWLLASASSDASVGIWDIRALKTPLTTLALPKASQAAEFAPDGSGRLAVTCFDDHIRVFSLAALAAASSKAAKSATLAPKPLIKHCTATGRWVVPFRATWTAGGDAVLVGGMKRTAELYDAASGRKVASLSAEHMTAIPSRNAAHPNGRVIAAATNSGRIHLFQA